MRTPKGNLPRVITDEDFPKETLHSVLGIQLTEHGDGFVKGHVPVTDRIKQELGLVHGGVYAAMAESMASYGTAIGAGEDKFVAGLSNHTSFLRPVFKGDTITAVAEPRHRGRTTWVWEVSCTDGRQRACALVRVTIAVRDARA